MKQLYEKNELTFAIVWIAVYCVLQSLANPLNEAIGKPLERRCDQLHAGRNGLPYRVYALRWIPGGSAADWIAKPAKAPRQKAGK